MSLIRIRIISFTKKEITNKLTPQRFMCHTPIYEIKLTATINPKRAGYQSPSFFTEGENTAGKLNTIQVKPNTQTKVSNFGRFLIMDSIWLLITNHY